MMMKIVMMKIVIMYISIYPSNDLPRQLSCHHLRASDEFVIHMIDLASSIYYKYQN